MTDVYSNRQPAGAVALVEGRHVHRRVSWSALTAGVVLTVSVQLSLTLLGAAIGFGTVDVQTGGTPSAAGLGTGAGLWWLISGCLSLFVGGYVAAWLGGVEIRRDGVLHGLVTWGVATLFSVYLLTSAVGGLLGGGFSALSGITSSLGSGIKSAAAPVADATGLSPDMVKHQAEAFLEPAPADPATMSPQEAQKEVASNVLTYEKGGPDAAAAKARVIDITAAQLKISHDAAAQKFDETQAKLTQIRDQAVQKAKAAADATAAAASKACFSLVVTLLLGAIAAGLGGALGLRRR